MTMRYLERVEISDFRAYGHRFTLSLPAGPGVTLIHGPNGLGKTTFFDAIEWCLTGDIQRFRDYRRGTGKRSEDHLTRIGAAKRGAHRVSLYFTGAEPLDRGRGMQPALQDVVALLKEPQWPGVSDLSLYLSLTHFFGQSATQRFSVKRPDEQWKALQGPAGVDRVNFIRERLGGQGMRQAFNRQIREADDDVEKARNALAEARALIEQLSRVRSLARLRESISPLELVDACSQLIRAVSLDGSALEDFDSNASPEAVLEQTGELVRSARQRVQGAVALADSLEVLVGEIQSAQAERSLLNEVITSEEAKRDDLEISLSQLSDRLSVANGAAEAARAEFAEANAQMARCDRIITAIDNVTRSADRQVVLRDELARAEQEIGELNEAYSRLKTESDELVLRASAQAEAARELEVLRAAAKLADEVEQTVQDAERDLGDAPVEDVLRALMARREELTVRTSALNAQIRGLESELAEIDRRSGAIAALVGQLHGLLRQDDVQCPVCATEFAHGELLARVPEIPESSNSSAKSLGQQLSAANAELAQTARETDAVTQKIDQLELSQQTLLRAAERRSEIIMRVLQLKPDARVVTLADVRSLAAAAEQKASSAEVMSLGARDERTVRGEMRSLEQERALIAERVASLRAELSAALRAIDSARAVLDEATRDRHLDGDLIEAVTEERLSATRSAATAAPRIEQTEGEYRQLQLLEKAALESRREVETALRRARQKAAELDERLADLLERWAKADPVTDVSLATAWRFRDRANHGERAVREAEGQLAEFAEGYQTWREDAERRRLEEALQLQFQKTGTADESSLEAHLERTARAAEQISERLRATQGRALKIADDLKEQAERYAQNVLQPLSEMIRSYSRALMLSADDSLDYRALFRANRSEFRPGVMRRGVMIDRDPNLYFSEGQLSALSVSALLAASTAFRWSRWPALLMDDPLQHNDVIHASAFIDLMRRLVQKLGYQIIMSTHDSDEAAFIGRKCESANVPFQLCTLTPSSGNGLVAY